MNGNLSDFRINDIFKVNKEFLEGKFFKLHIKNKDYVILITRVGVSLMDIEVYNIKHQIDENNPVEHELRRFNDQWDIHVNFFNPKSYYQDLYLGDFLENYEYELSVIEDKTLKYVEIFYKSQNLIKLIDNTILYKNLKKPKNSFEERFSKFILEICYDIINDNDYLFKKLKNRGVWVKKREKETEEFKRYLEEKDKEYQKGLDKYRSVLHYSGDRRIMDAEKFLR